MELKYLRERFLVKQIQCSNCTFMELKYMKQAKTVNAAVF